MDSPKIFFDKNKNKNLTEKCPNLSGNYLINIQLFFKEDMILYSNKPIKVICSHNKSKYHKQFLPYSLRLSDQLFTSNIRQYNNSCS